MTKKLYLPLLVALVAVLTSCSSKMGELSSDYFTVTPQVLEAVGGKVPATINGKFPEKYFKKKAVVEVTPVLRWEGGEAKGQPAVFQGEKVEGNDQTISYKAGGSYTMKTSFDYVPEMAKSELYLEFKAKVGKKEVTIPAVKVADGVISTSELVGQTLGSANPANGDDAFQRVIKEKYDANIMFLIQQANIRSSELKTAKAFNEEVKNINEAANKKISNIEISAYASPDGGVELNTGLAENRQNNTAKVINKDLKKSKIEAAVDTKYTAQDWEGFQELVSKSNIQDKELILRVLSMYSDPEQREQEIKNISSVYSTLAEEILPQLRRSRLTLNYDVIGKSDEEIASLADSDAKQLNIEELLYAAALTNDPAKQEAIFTKATQIYESQRPDALGGPDEHLQSTGRGDSDGGAYQQLSFFLSENEQIRIIDEAENVKTSSAFSFAQANIDHVLRLGGNTDRQRERIVAAFEKQKSTAEIAEILKTLYHGGNGIGSVTAWYAEDGIHLSHGKTARYDKSAQVISWESAAERIGQLLQDGNFATNVELTEAAGYERSLLAEKLWHLYHDFSDKAREAGYLSCLSGIRRNGQLDI